MNFITTIYSIMFFFGIYFLSLFIILYYNHKKELYYSPPLKSFPSVTFLVPAFNEQDSISETIKRILEVDYPIDRKEIIVINDGSADNTEKIVKEFVKKNKGVKLLNKKYNSGKADSLNKAINFAGGELIAVTDADSYPEADSLKRMIGFFEDKQVAAVTSRVLVKNRRNFIEKFQAFDYNVIAWTRKLLDFIGCVYVTNGPLSIYRKELIVKVGGFDTKNVTEDIEITWNFLSKGYKTKLSYSTRVYTTVPNTFKGWNKQRVRWNVGGLQTINKYKNFFFRGENLFGYFVISYVGLSFLLSLVGIALLLRLFLMKFKLLLFSIPLFFQGYNPLIFLNFDFYITILVVLALIFFILTFVYYKLSIMGSDLENRGVLSIIIYTFIYRPLYLIPLILSLYKIFRGQIGWYTK